MNGALVTQYLWYSWKVDCLDIRGESVSRCLLYRLMKQLLQRSNNRLQKFCIQFDVRHQKTLFGNISRTHFCRWQRSKTLQSKVKTWKFTFSDCYSMNIYSNIITLSAALPFLEKKVMISRICTNLFLNACFLFIEILALWNI